jgi:hypothetical protein
VARWGLTLLIRLLHLSMAIQDMYEKLWNRRLRPHWRKNPDQWQEGEVSRGKCLHEEVWRFGPICEYRISENYPRMRLSIQVAVQLRSIRLRRVDPLYQNLSETDWTVFCPNWFNPRSLDDYGGLCRRVNN